MELGRITGRHRRGRLLTRALLVGFVLASVMATAGPASAATRSKVAATLNVNIDGRWTDVGVAKPLIEVNGSSVFIDMSYANRPNATGIVVGPSKIQVNFPGDNVYIGNVTATQITWSNGSTWRKVFEGTQIFEVEGVWRSDATGAITNLGRSGAFLGLDVGSGPGLKGFMTSATTIRVQFSSNDVDNATLGAPNFLRWGNGDQWRRLSDLPTQPGTPQCFC
jgi:hypothetical protein